MACGGLQVLNLRLSRDPLVIHEVEFIAVFGGVWDARRFFPFVHIKFWEKYVSVDLSVYFRGNYFVGYIQRYGIDLRAADDAGYG